MIMAPKRPAISVFQDSSDIPDPPQSLSSIVIKTPQMSPTPSKNASIFNMFLFLTVLAFSLSILLTTFYVWYANYLSEYVLEILSRGSYGIHILGQGLILGLFIFRLRLAFINSVFEFSMNKFYILLSVNGINTFGILCMLPTNGIIHGISQSIYYLINMILNIFIIYAFTKRFKKLNHKIKEATCTTQNNNDNNNNVMIHLATKYGYLCFLIYLSIIMGQFVLHSITVALIDVKLYRLLTVHITVGFVSIFDSYIMYLGSILGKETYKHHCKYGHNCFHKIFVC